MILCLDEDCWYYTVNVGEPFMGAKDERRRKACGYNLHSYDLTRSVIFMDFVGVLLGNNVSLF